MTHTLPEHLRSAMLDLLDQEQRQADWATPGDLAQHLDPRIRQTPALELIDATILECLNTPDGRLIISMPPQEGKSQRAAIATPVWQLHRDPDTRISVASYAQGLANRNGRAIRNAIVTHPDLGMAIAADNGAVSEWTLAGHDGGVLSVGRGAGITGRPVDLLIIDDPLKDRAEADSETIRDTCWDWWTDALSARLAPGAPVVLILTRWHEFDLAGRLIADDAAAGWRVLNIPAQCEDANTDPLGRQPGEYMISTRGRSTAQWEQRKKTAGSRTWAALYQGRPSPAEGGIFKREWWQQYDTPQWLIRDDGSYWATGFDEVLISADLTFKGTDHSDYVAVGVWARRNADAWLLDQICDRWDFVTTLKRFEALCAKWPQATLKLVEDKANGPALISMLGKRIPGIVPVTPEGGKEVRANAWAPLVEAGNVWIPSSRLAPWASDYIEQHAAFPNAAHDDMVDQSSQAVDRLILRPLLDHTRTIDSFADYFDNNQIINY